MSRSGRLIACGAALAGLASCSSSDPTWGPCGPWWTAADLPLLVTYDPTARDFAASIEEAITVWNKVRPGLFLAGDELDIDAAWGTIVGIEGVAGDRGETEVRRAGCRVLRAEVRMPHGSPRPTRRLAHELGHVLHLAHDGTLDSVMHPDSARGGLHVTVRDRGEIVRALGPAPTTRSGASLKP